MTDEIMQKLDVVAKGVHDFQDEHKRLEDRINILDEEKLVKISDDVAKTLEDINKLEQHQKAIEKIVTRENFVSGSKEICSESKAAYLNYLRRGTIPDVKFIDITNDSIARNSLLGASEHQIEMAKKDLAVGSNPDGGYFVRPEVANFMIERIFETSPMRQIASVMTISTESMIIVIDDNEAVAGWVGEVDARPDTATNQIGELSIHSHELYAQPRATQKMIDDAGFDIESWLQQKISDRFARLENTAFVTGNGAKRPRGFLDYPAWATPGTYERGHLEHFNSGTSGAFDGDNLVDLQGLLIEDYQPNATWVMKRATWREVMKAKNGIGDYLLNPIMLAQSAEMILLGKPVLFFEDMPAIAADALAIAYGDFRRGYTIVDRIGIRILRDPYTSKPYIRYYTTKRVGGDVTNYESIKILKLAV